MFSNIKINDLKNPLHITKLFKDGLPTVLLVIIGCGKVEDEAISLLLTKNFENVRMIVTLSHHDAISAEQMLEQATNLENRINNQLLSNDPRLYKFIGGIPYRYPGESIDRRLNIFVNCPRSYTHPTFLTIISDELLSKVINPTYTKEELALVSICDNISLLYFNS